MAPMICTVHAVLEGQHYLAHGQTTSLFYRKGLIPFEPFFPVSANKKPFQINFD